MKNKVHPSFSTVLIKVGQNVITGEMIFYTLPVIYICVTLYPVLNQIQNRYYQECFSFRFIFKLLLPIELISFIHIVNAKYVSN